MTSLPDPEHCDHEWSVHRMRRGGTWYSTNLPLNVVGLSPNVRAICAYCLTITKRPLPPGARRYRPDDE